jgi:septal ring factor EnvC (AmiA/AmiB activator)
LLEDALLKGPVVKLPVGTKLLPPKHNETLVGVKTNKNGDIICAKYNTRDRTYFEGVCTHPSKVKFLPPKDVPKHALAASKTPRKRRRTVDDLEKEFEAQRATIASIEASLHLHSRCIIHTNKKVEDVQKDNKKLDKRLSTLEPPKLKK